MKSAWALWLSVPLIGVLFATGFPPQEADWATFLPADRVEAPGKMIPLPDGSVMRFLGVPDQNSGRAGFWLAERELSRAEMRALGFVPRGRGISAAVSYDEALEVTERLSQLTGLRARLPTTEERRTAARGGVPNAEVPWGFGLENPPQRLSFDLSAPSRTSGPPLGFGFRDLAGGMWEWTLEGHAAGGAWAERNPSVLRIDHTLTLPEGYRGADTGMRVLIEAD
jgi:hypothetical protein